MICVEARQMYFLLNEEVRPGMSTIPGEIALNLA